MAFQKYQFLFYQVEKARQRGIKEVRPYIIQRLVLDFKDNNLKPQILDIYIVKAIEWTARDNVETIEIRNLRSEQYSAAIAHAYDEIRKRDR